MHASARRTQYATAAAAARHRDSRYLLLGVRALRDCGGGFAVAQSQRTAASGRCFYACTSHWKRGAGVCANNLVAPMDVIDAEVLAIVAG